VDRALAQDQQYRNKRAEAARYNLNWLSATGTGILVASILSAVWMGVSPYRFVRVFLITLYRMRIPLVTIAAMLAIAYTTRYSGLDATLGLAFTRTGVLYPFFAAMLGWLGVALTGSDTSSNERLTGTPPGSKSTRWEPRRWAKEPLSIPALILSSARKLHA
jgi:L-lactate permease